MALKSGSASPFPWEKDTIPDPALEKLIDLSFSARDSAYCPYSKFPVGSAVMCKDGTYYTGCNVENAAYPLGVCAEKAAVVKAVSEGHRDIKCVAVSSAMKNSFITPCGACRQFLAEFGMDMDVYMTKPDRSYVKMKVRELLPLGFDGSKLNEEILERKTRVTRHHSGQFIANCDNDVSCELTNGNKMENGDGGAPGEQNVQNGGT